MDKGSLWSCDFYDTVDQKAPLLFCYHLHLCICGPDLLQRVLCSQFYPYFSKNCISEEKVNSVNSVVEFFGPGSIGGEFELKDH